MVEPADSNREPGLSRRTERMAWIWLRTEKLGARYQQHIAAGMAERNLGNSVPLAGPGNETASATIPMWAQGWDPAAPLAAVDVSAPAATVRLPCVEKLYTCAPPDRADFS